MFQIVVMVSGGGTNLQAIMDAIEDGKITGVRITSVISNNADAYALKRAENAGIPTRVVSRKEIPDRDAYDKALLTAVEEVQPDLIVLAGFLVVIPGEMIRRFPHRIINIHPSLIPAFCGTGYYGLKVHEAALKRGVKLSGATVHFVDEGTDTGPILLQKAVEVLPQDTPESLQKRIMEQAEWVLLPQAIQMLAHRKT